VLEWTGSNWSPRKAKPNARADDEVSEEGADSQAAAATFLRSHGPLRFNHWLELSLGNPPSPPADGGKVKLWRRLIRPPVVSAFAAREPFLVGEFGLASQHSALARRTGFRLEATAAVLNGRALGSFDRGSLSLWWARDNAAASVAEGVRGVLSASHHIARALERAANFAAKASETSSVLSRQLQDDLFAALDMRLGEMTQRMFAVFAESADEDLAREKVTELRSGLVRAARDEALNMFDASFPFATIDQRAIRIVGARRKLESDLSRIVASETPHLPTVGTGGQTEVVVSDSHRQAPLVG
jgi:hypothetical protein